MTMKKGSFDPLVDKTAYQKIIGKLLYLALTRPDILFSVQTLTQFQTWAKVITLEPALRIDRYMMKQLGQGIRLSNTTQEQISAHSNVDCTACPNSRISLIEFFC